MQVADRLVGAMTREEKLSLLQGDFPQLIHPLPLGVIPSAGLVPGVARLGAPPLKETDASLGVANAGRSLGPETSLPSGLAIAASFDEKIAYLGGRMVGAEARADGFNVLLGGGVNLVRDPRNGRNFEYLGEDPLLAGRMAGAAVRGVQSNHVIATVKHFALNAQESGRHVLDALIDPGALRESDLLAFEIAVEQGDPGSVMCAYNKVNGAYACENAPLLQALKRDWKFKGFVMSDWGAVHSSSFAVNAGLDQQSGRQLDPADFFGADLRKALAAGAVTADRLDDMARRVIWAEAETGVLQDQTHPPQVDFSQDREVTRKAAASGIVLLKNASGLLPLSRTLGEALVVGGHADFGVLSGGGSSQVIPKGSLILPPEGKAPGFVRSTVYHPSSPLAALQKRLGAAKVVFLDGSDREAVRTAAGRADVVVVFATQWTTEGADADMALSDGQNAIIQAAAAVNPHVVVVLETGGPVKMPWLTKVAAVIEAWYPGSAGGDAIADILLGDQDPSGRLPVTFPAEEAQLPRPVLDGGLAPAEGATGGSDAAPFSVDYKEGADLGYRWFEKRGETPLFPFGFGLSYAKFQLEDLQVDPSDPLTVRVNVRNVSDRAGSDTPQIYMKPPGGQKRLVGWRKVILGPHQSETIEITVDPRTISQFDVRENAWRRVAGKFEVIAGESAIASQQNISINLPSQRTDP